VGASARVELAATVNDNLAYTHENASFHDDVTQGLTFSPILEDTYFVQIVDYLVSA
jgi:hypothetical protein